MAVSRTLCVLLIVINVSVTAWCCHHYAEDVISVEDERVRREIEPNYHHRPSRKPGREKQRHLTREPLEVAATTQAYDETSAAFENQDDQENCTLCEWREERKRVRLEMIKEDILRKLHMEAPPNISVKPEDYPKIPMLNFTLQPMDDLKEMEEEEDEEEEDNEVTRVITFAEPPPDEQKSLLQDAGVPLNDVIYFSFAADMDASRISQAMLYVYIKERRYGRGTALMEMYKIYRDKEGKLNWEREPNIRKEVPLKPDETGKWLTFHLKNIAEEWIHRPSENFGLRIKALDPQRRQLAVLAQPSNDEEKLYKPFLAVQLGKKKPRKRRSHATSRDCSDGSDEWRCCRYPLVVDFDKFGWDFIMQPRQYAAFYCTGKCPLAMVPNSPHAHILSLAKTDHSVGPCCTPVKMSPISMIYFDDKFRLMYRILKDMQVDRCACN